MTDQKEFLEEMKSFERQAKELYKKFHNEDGDLEVDFATDPDSQQILESYNSFFYLLQDIVGATSYLNYPTREVGTLYYNDDNERYYHGDTELHAGDTFEVLIEDDGYNEYPYWYATRIEYSHNDEGWYLVGKSNLRLDGLKVRVREW